MAGEERITTKQLAVLLIFVIIGDMILVLPSIISSSARQDAWIAALIGLGAGLLLAVVQYSCGISMKRSGFVGLNRTLLGRWAGGVVTLLFILFFMVNCTLMVRETSDFLTTQLFPETPLRAIHFIMIMTIVIGAKYGLTAIARSGEIFFPIFIFLYMALVLLLIPEIDLVRLKPLLGTPLPQFAYGSLVAAVFPFCEMVVMMMILPHVTRRPHMSRDYYMAVVIGGLGSFLVVLFSLLVLGGEMTAFYLYPAYALSQKISVGHFLERLEALLAVNMILSTYIKTVLYFYVFLSGTAQWLGLRDYKSIVVPAGMILFGLAYLFSPTIVYYNTVLLKYWIDVDILFGFVLPLVLLTLYKWKTARGRKRPGAKPT
ncbi:GerAB/ArcD/ProY family transporter [Paenibacillus ginsengarvi]|uniref:Uncharacterized protein n=1 Tax=Paenibacillus ginsengarvi TaxID=400777 RepID=A0A3B0CHV2_9BACL|nr:endospore germination permease [Paenibacillus ginsengarvi]RKN84782.1 hypothetical protein D7M11_12415 [Paenibacillus ginsengarvi]